MSDPTADVTDRFHTEGAFLAKVLREIQERFLAEHNRYSELASQPQPDKKLIRMVRRHLKELAALIDEIARREDREKDLYYQAFAPYMVDLETSLPVGNA
jgi:hypothetical protein